MKAIALFCNNGDEIDKAEKLEMDLPEMTFDHDDFYFRISEVSVFLKNKEGGINIFIYGDKWTLEWNQNVWDKLVKEFE